MIKRLICAVLVVALAASLWYVASVTYDTEFAITAEDQPESAATGEDGEVAAFADDGSLTLWYSDEALTDYVTSVALSFEQDRGIKVNTVLKDGVQFLEAINANSILEPADRI